MSAAPDETQADRALMAAVARSHYLDGVPRTEIADQLGISRFKVARLLARAREEGVVTIEVHDLGLVDPLLSERLGAALGLRECRVVRSHGDGDSLLQQIGAAAADLITETVREGDVLGVTWGRSLIATTSQLVSLPRVTVVQLTGFVSGDLGASSPVEAVRQVSQRARGSVHPIFAPLYIKDAATAETLRQHADIDAAVRLFPSVTTAVLSVGSWDPPVSQVREVLSPEDVAHATGLGCIGDIAGILVRADGQPVDLEFQRRAIAISYEQLKAVPRVIAVAGGSEKATAIRAVVDGGLVTSLVTDHTLAQAVLATHEG